MVVCFVYSLFYVENTEALFQQANGICWGGGGGGGCEWCDHVSANLSKLQIL
jgi:hypothetical protein